MTQSADEPSLHDGLPEAMPDASTRGDFRAWSPYFQAIVWVAIATVVTVVIPALKERTSLILFFASVVISSHFGGMGPAVLAVVLSASAWMALVVSPTSIGGTESAPDFLRLVLYVALALFTSYLQARHDRTKRELRKQKYRLDLALEAGRMGVWDYDMRRGEFWISPALREIFAVSVEEFAPTYGAFLSFVHPDDRPAVVRSMTTSRDSRIDYQLEHRIVRRDGTIGRIATRGRTFVDANGRAERMIGVVVELAENESVEAETQASGVVAQSRYTL